MASNTKRIRNFWRNFPTLAKRMSSKVLFVSKKTRRPFDHLRAKIVWIVGNVKWVKTIFFVLNYLNVFECTKTIIHLSVGG